MAFLSGHDQRAASSHRPDIDGLRAIAILSVVVFHAFPYSLPGGFTGVDVFFVISGFLISSIIFRNLADGDFRFAVFYARRVRRLFPALIVVLVSCYALGWLLLLPDEFKQLGKHMAAGAAFVQNFAIWKEAGYFDTATELKPLMHLWSLAVEEQFYLLYPIIVWMAWRLGISVLAVVFTCALFSFGINITEAGDETVKAFFVPQTRFWELLAGALLAYRYLLAPGKLAKEFSPKPCRLAGFKLAVFPIDRKKELSNLLAASGLILIFIALLAIDRTNPLPGWRALIPVAGAGLLIHAGPQAWVNRKLLSNRLMVWVGLISYPLYLWHWPLLSFVRILTSGEPRPDLQAVAIAVSFVLAWLTYELIEIPIRFGQKTRVKTGALASSIVCAGLLGFSTYLGDGWPDRRSATSQVVYEGDTGHLAFHEYGVRKFHTCTPDSIAQAALRWDGFIRCQQSRANSVIDIALLGDSHAEHLFFGLAEALPHRNLVFYIKSDPAFIGNSGFAPIYTEVMANKAIKKVILSMVWQRRSGQPAHGSNLENEILTSARALIASGKEVYLTNDVPHFPFEPTSCRTQRTMSSERSCSIVHPGGNTNSYNPDKMIRAIAEKEPRIRMIDTYSHFCDKETCKMTDGNQLLYRDNNHLNILGSRYLGKLIVRNHPDL